MAWSGSTFTRTNGTYSGATVWEQDYAAGQTISPIRVDAHDQDMAQGINACLNKNGANSPTASINWGGHRITNLGNATTDTDAVAWGQTIKYITTEAELVAYNLAGTPIYLKSAITLTASRSVSVPITIYKGGSITCTGFILTLSGPFSAPIAQCFTAVSGEVVFAAKSVNYVHPEWFGAIGDNSTNCTAAIQAAIGSVKGAGGVVQFIAGNYRHTGITLPSKVHLRGINPKASDLRFTPTSGNAISLEDGTNDTSYQTITQLGIRAVTNSSGNAISSPLDYYVADVVIDDYEIEGFLKGIYLPYGLQVQVGFGRLLGRGAAVANGVGVQLGDRTHTTPRLVNTAQVWEAYANGYHTSFVSDGSIHQFNAVVAENCTRSFLIASRCIVQASWVQATTTLFETRTAGWPISAIENYYLNGASAEQDDISSMCTLNGQLEDLGVLSKSEVKGPGQFRMRFATSLARGLRFGTDATKATLYEASGAVRIEAAGNKPLEVNREDAGNGIHLLTLSRQKTTIGTIGVSADGNPVLFGQSGTENLEWDTNKNVRVGEGAVATTATNGFVYISTCAGTPTGVPSAKSGFSPLVIDTTNNRFYFYSGGAWRNAGP